MAKARKARGTAKRSVKKRVVKTAKLKGRKVRKTKAPKRPVKRGVIAGAVAAVKEAVGLRQKLEGRNTFED